MRRGACLPSLRRILATLVVIGLVAGSAEARAADAPPAAAESATDIARAVAIDLIKNILPEAQASAGGRLKIAVQPFNATEVNDVQNANQLNRDVEAALSTAGQGHVVIVEREQFAKVWAEANNFQGSEPTERFRSALRDAGADVLVWGTLDAAAGGYNVGYRAVDVRESKTGTVLAFTTQPRPLKSSFSDRAPRGVDDALANAARLMAQRLVADARIGDGPVSFVRSGEESPVVTMLLNNFEDRLQDQIKEAVRVGGSSARAFTGEAAAAPVATVIDVSAAPSEIGTWVEVTFQAQVKDRGAAVGRTVRILRDDPAVSRFLPLNRIGPFTATADAVVKAPLDLDAATRAARALARARVIAQSTNQLQTVPLIINGLTDGAKAMQAIAGGVTTAERWDDPQVIDNGARVRVTLHAKVRPLGSRDGPKVTAVMSSGVVESGAPFRLTLSSDTPCVVAVFGWTSDDQVTRLYPYGRHPAVSIGPGKSADLPRSDEGEIGSELRPGTVADFESLIIVASAQPLNWDKIANEPGKTYADTNAQGRSAQEVFEALAQLPGRFSVNIVPYQVVAKK
jgi:hypothetical protein